jgi:hypothetical protein
MNDRERRKQELDAVIAEQDERARRRDTQAAAQRDLGLLRARLLGLGLFKLDEFVGKARGNWHFDEETGELRVWWLIDGTAFSVVGGSDGPIYVEHKVNDVYEWTVLDANGRPTKWLREPPPWSSLN